MLHRALAILAPLNTRGIATRDVSLHLDVLATLDIIC